MSNLIPTNIKIPAHLAKLMNQPSVLGDAISGGIGGGADFPRISIKGARFRIKDGDAETVLQETYLDVVIVGANPRLSKTWYAKQWTPDAEPAAPDCYSLDGIRPNADSANIQNDLCATCPHNAWGSKITPQGQKVKACADQKRLAVVAANDPSGPIYLLSVTPAALKGLNQYHSELKMRGIPVEGIKTRISFDTNASFPKLTFGFGGFLDEDTVDAVSGLFGSSEVKQITGEEAAPVAAPVEVEKPKPMLVKPKAAPAPAPVEEEVEEETPAPAPKRGFTKAAAPAEDITPPPAPKPKAAPKVAPATSNIADEIAALIGEANADDA